MTPGDWQHAKEILFQAWDLDPAQRGAFLDEACATDAELRRRVEALLASDRSTGELPSAPLLEMAVAAGLGPPTPAVAGRRVGPYQIVRELGHGGMGTVYLAERVDGQFRKRVAIKLIHSTLTNESMVRRFRRERQVEAALDHPNIARLLDGGATQDGLPYLVMEFVDGVPIDEWCDCQKLTVPDRVKLFRQVCSAVQYAHDKQVIHRDIKPANILVTEVGTPKLLDFGIAKVLNPELATGTLETTVGPGLMTPEYASPEQVKGEPIGPASDIYSLGVLLYRLLTSRLPYSVRGGDLPQMARVVCEQAPVKPSVAAGNRQLRGDLDNIVLIALRKEPQRRYATVEQFSEDLGRFLQDLPVRAHKESLPYRGGKFLKRNRALLTAVAVTAVIGVVTFVALGRTNRTNIGAVAPERDSPWNHLKFEKIATLGDPAPGGGVLVHDFEPYGVHGNGDILFVSDISADGSEGIFLKKNRGALVPLAYPEWPAPGGGVFTAGVVGGARMNDSGDVIFAFGLKPWTPPELKGFNRVGIYRYSQADRKLSAVVIPGVTIATGFGVFQSTPGRANLNKLGDIAFSALVRTTAGVLSSTGLGQGIFLVDRNAHITRVVVPGDPAPGAGTFDYATNPWINDRGDIAFGGHVAGEECIQESGYVINATVGCMESIFLKRAEKPNIETIAHQGQGGMYGLIYRYLWGPILNNRDDLVFMAELTPRPGVRGVRTNSGLFLHSADRVVGIALPADTMPDGRKVTTLNPSKSSTGYSLNNRGDIVFSAALENGESGLYLYSRGTLHLIAGTGTVIPNIGTVSGIPNISIECVLNDSGQILFSTRLADGKGVLLLATPQPGVSKT